MLHVAQISFFLDPQGRTATEILRDWWPLVDCAEAVTLTGTRVTVIQACGSNSTATRNGVNYHFVAPEKDQRTIVSGERFQSLIKSLQADVFHIHGLLFPRDVLELARIAPGTPTLIQDHANHVPRFWRLRGMRRGMAGIAGVSFCARAQAVPFVKAGIIPARATVYEIPECSSRFTPGDRDEARQLTGLRGDPAVLWVGHLDANKDPLTVLRGVRAAIRELPGLELWCCYGQAPLLGEIRAFLANEPEVATRVHLLGRLAHEKIETLMRAADLFVSASHREGSGCALIEALACGLPPVVADIPSFRALTGDGSVGALWRCEDSRALANAMSIAALSASRRETRAHFDRELSFLAVGTKLQQAYRALVGGKHAVDVGTPILPATHLDVS